MRTKFFILLMIMALAACGGKSTDPTDQAAANATAEATVPAEDQGLGDSVLAIQFEPIGEVALTDGTIIPIVEFKQISKYYIYITGKLNGRASTVISLTRLDDMMRWAGIAFKDPNNFVIITRDQKQRHFTDSRIFIGTDSHENFSFITSGDNYTTQSIDVKKADISTIKFMRAKEEE